MNLNNDSEIMDHEHITTRPWVRYWARYIDMYYLIVLIMILQKLLFPTQQLDLNLLAVGVYIIWILFEAQFLATWGTTPGKWLLKTKVRDTNHNKLSLKTSLIRAFLVWFIGLGMAIFTPFAEIIAYFNLKNRGFTVWDKHLGCNVIHEDFGPERIPLITVAVILPLFILELIW